MDNLRCGADSVCGGLVCPHVQVDEGKSRRTGTALCSVRPHFAPVHAWHGNLGGVQKAVSAFQEVERCSSPNEQAVQLRVNTRITVAIAY